MEIREQEKRRARNLIWNAAWDYSFEPDFAVYDEEGRADLYWNSIIGAVRRNYGAGPIEELFSAIHGCENENLYEQLIWLGLENAVYRREADLRPALPSLRRSYARRVIAARQGSGQMETLEVAHFRRALGETPALAPWDRQVLDALEFSGDWDAETLTANALQFLREWFGFVPGKTQEEERKKRRKKRFPFFRRGNPGFDLPSVRSFGRGYGEHSSAGEGEIVEPEQRRISDKTAAQTEEALKQFIRDFFGTPLYDAQTSAALERELCTDNHKGCHLYYAEGSMEYDPNIRGYTTQRRLSALKQMERNRKAYEEDAVRHRNSVLRLTARIRNAMMAYLQPTVSRTSSGTLEGGRVWRGVYLDDDKVFTRVLRNDPGDLCVDLLLDASASQTSRQEIVSAQGYMIAEALTRCGIPVRVSSFCSLSGYTVITRYRDYFEGDKNDRIFRYFAAGCNRDGLAVRALCRDMADAPCEHKLVILLSDAKPNDVIRMDRNGRYVPYAGEEGVLNTASEVRSLLNRGITVICVFTGEDDAVPAAHTIYGRDFARIRSLDQFADTVGTLIQNQIRSF